MNSSSAFFFVRILMLQVLKAHPSPFLTCFRVWWSWRKLQILPSVRLTKEQLLSNHCSISLSMEKSCQRPKKCFRILLRNIIHGKLDRRKKEMPVSINCLWISWVCNRSAFWHMRSTIWSPGQNATEWKLCERKQWGFSKWTTGAHLKGLSCR